MSRPTKYKKEFDELLIKHMESGMSFMSFAALVGVNVDTLYEWERKQKSFSEAKQVAFNKNLLFWERLGVAGTAGKIHNFNSTTWIFNMKNRHGWRDRREVEHSGNQELPVKFQSMPETKLNELIEKAVSILKDE
jgi:hypothetical protein